MRSRHFVLAVASVLVFAVGSAKAVSIVGSSVTGVFTVGVSTTNGFDPANGFVPSTGYLNSSTAQDSDTVTISASAIEFGAQNTNDLVTADFTATTLTVTDDRIGASTVSGGGAMTFTDTAFGGITKMSDTFTNGGTSDSISGDVISLSWGGGTVTSGDTYTAVYCLTPASSITTSVPEPATIAMGLLAFPAIGLWLMKRRQARTA